MNVRARIKGQRHRGNTLMITIITTALIGLVLAGYLGLVTAQNQAIMRSQAWNSCIAIAEAGIEEALTQLRDNYQSNLLCNGWTLNNGKVYMTRNLSSNYFRVYMSPAAPFSITAEGYVYLPWNNTYICRTVKVDTISQGLYSKALVLKNKVNMNGNNIVTDSYDSTDPLKSTLGVYDPLKRGDHGDVACTDGFINVGNANVWGRVVTGPKGTVNVGASGAVGSISWQIGGNNGIQPGWWITDMNLNFPPVKPPFTSATTPGSNASWNYILGDGNYSVSSVSGKMLVQGHATLYVAGDVTLSPSDVVKVNPNSSLKIYVGGKKADFGEVQLGTPNATNLFIYGLPSVKSVSISGNNNLTAVIYAPNASMTLNGGMEVFGSIVCKDATLTGHSKFHYDESLGNEGQARGFIITAWNEL